ncbi:MAG: AraC family transcriptional regulator, partial [Candidatus Eremiobacteraeota bacterium]|nr:AraC family transcriptional regulator [Candidatus Eremiobacteraeota bacterium]
FVLPEEFQGIVLQFDHDALGKSLFPKKQFMSGAENLWSFAHFVVQMGSSLSQSAREALGERCLEILLSELPSSAVDRCDSLSCRRRAAMQAADLIHRKPQASLAMKTLCAHTHVSERTLREGFVDVFGLPPMEYLLALRLNLVRSRLRSGGPGVTVAQAATEQGFWHLSRFAGQYRRFFGECPSQTMRVNAENG